MAAPIGSTELVHSAIISRTFPSITRYMLALYCGASGDTNPIHVDLDHARKAGFSDVFAHGMLVMAFVGVMLEEAGPAEAIRSFSVRFTSMTQLGAQLTCEATVAEWKSETLMLNVRAVDQEGDVKAQGTAVVERSSWEKSFGKA